MINHLKKILKKRKIRKIMAKGYREMGEINLSIEKEYMSFEDRELNIYQNKIKKE